jgi:hypothetical protein
LTSPVDEKHHPSALVVGFDLVAWLSLLNFEMATAKPVLLKAGRRYALELSGERQALTIYPRASRSDVYAAGAALGVRGAIDMTPLGQRR